MSLTAEQIEAKTKLIEEYMAEIEIQLRTGLEIIDELKRSGLDSAKDVINSSVEDLLKRTELEEETIIAVQNILRQEFED